MVAVWINEWKYLRSEGLKLKMNFVKKFGPGRTWIVVEIQKIKQKLVPKKTNLNGGDLGWNKKKCCDCGENSKRKNE